MRGLIGFSAGLITGSLATWAVIEIGSGGGPLRNEPAPEQVAPGTDRARETPAPNQDAPSPSEAPASRKIAAADDPTIHRVTAPARRDPDGELDVTESVSFRTFSVVQAELQALIESGRTDRRAFKKLFDDLVRLGTDESIGLVIATLEDPNVDFSWQATVFAEALDGVDDPRILPACARKVAANEAGGLTSWTDVNGYVDLIAKSTAPAAAQTLLDLLENDTTAGFTSKAIANLSDHTRGIEFAERLEGAPLHVGKQLAESLASWNDADVNRRMLDAASNNPSMNDETRKSVFEGLSKNARLDDVQRLLASPDPDHAQAAAYGAAKNPNLTADQKRSLVVPVVHRGLHGDDPGRFQSSIYTLEYNDELHTEGVLQTLTRLLDQSTDARRSREIKRALSEMRSN